MRSNRLKLIQCPNCENQLSKKDNFCPNCGQPNHDLKVPIKHLLLDVIEGLVHFDGKLFQTLGILLFHPGQLSIEFQAGKRIRYVQPIRLYIFISFVFFFLLAYDAGHSLSDTSENSSGTDSSQVKEPNQTRTTLFEKIDSKELRGLSNAQIDSLMTARGVKTTTVNRFVARKFARIAAGGQEKFMHMLLKSVSNMMFALMPFLGLLLYLFYRKKSEYYLNALIFSVHFHCFLFLLLTIIFVIGWFVDSIFLFIAALLIITFYFYKALRNVYHQPRWITFLKGTAISGLHLVGLFALFSLTVAVSIFLF